MPWRPLPRIAFGIAKYPFQPASPADLPLELGDELYIIEEGGKDWAWFRGYLVAPPSLLAGLTSIKGQTLEARVFSGIFPRSCVEIREVLDASDTSEAKDQGRSRAASESRASLSEKARDAARSVNGVAEHAIEAKKLDQLMNGVATAQKGTATDGKPPIPPLPPTPTSPSPTAGLDAVDRERPPAPVPMLKIGDETPTSAEEPLVDEIASCLREWHSTSLHELLLTRQYSTLDKLSKLVNQLDVARRQLMHGVLTNQEKEALREKIVWDLVRGNKMLKKDIVVRDPKQRGRLLLESDDPIEVSRLQSTMSLLDQPPKHIPENVNLHHLLVEFRESFSESKENPKLVLTLCTQKGQGPLQPLSEAFSMEVPTKDSLSRLVASGKLRTVITNLTSLDTGAAAGADSRLYVVLRLQVNQLVQQPAAQQLKSNPNKGSVRREGTVSGPPSAKAGRRSILWGKDKAIAADPQRLRSQYGKMEGISEQDEPASRSTSSPTSPNGSQKQSVGPQPLQYVKRVVGAGIVPLDRLLEQEDEAVRTVTLWSPGVQATSSDNINDWHPLVEQILTSPNGGWSRSQVLPQVRLHFHSFVSPDAQTLIRTTPTLLHNIQITPKMGFSGAPTKPRSDIYITIREPVLPLGASLSHPERGSVDAPHPSDLQNLQLTLEVRKITGERIDRCIFPSSESVGQTAWRSTAISRGEGWHQTFKLVIPTEDVPVSHIIMSIADFPGFPFALAWIPLWSNGAFLQDGLHLPILHVYDKTTSHTESGRGAYLSLPWDSKPSEPSKLSSLAGPVASIKLESYLCSTYFSQDQVLLKILKWKDQPEDQVLVLLRQLVFVPEIEIVKLVNDVFDALFAILAHRAGNEEFEDLVFTALVTVLGIVHDRRFRLDPVVHDYAEHRFDFPSAAHSLIRSYLRLTTRPTEYQNSRQLRATFKVGKQVIKFIIMSRQKLEQKEASVGIANSTNFYPEMQQLFKAFERQMRDGSAALIGSKTLIVQHMHTWLPELAPCFTEDQILSVATGFINACDRVEGKLILHKLVLIWNILKAALAMQCDSISEFVEEVHQWTKTYWGSTDVVTEQYREQVRLVCSIYSLLKGNYGVHAFEIYCKTLFSYSCIEASERPQGKTLSLLFPSTYPFPSKPIDAPKNFDENLIELAALKATFRFPNLVPLIDFSRTDLGEIMNTSLLMNISILQNDAFPDTWLTLHMFYHRGIYKMLQGVKPAMVNEALPSPDDAEKFNTELWRRYLLAILNLVRSPCLALETFPEQKRRAVWKICGDVREKGAVLLREIWNDLGWDTDAEERERYGLEKLSGYQVQYVPSLVSPIMELCLSVHEGLRRSAVGILQAMIISEWTLNGDLSVVETEIMNCLDNLFKTKAIGESAQQKLFIIELEDLFQSLEDTPDRDLWKAIGNLLSSVDHMLDLLFAVHTPEQNETIRIMHTLRLMDFLKGMQRQDIFISYIHRLSAVEAEAKHFKEAGLALRLHADLYDWDTTAILESLREPDFPKQTAFERREALFFEMIKFFEEGLAWEPALACYKELAKQYEHTVYDFSKLARLQRSTAKIYEQIYRGHIEIPRYFRVTYRGLGFGTNMRDKSFVFESSSTERLAGFTDRIQQQYPSAQIMHKEDNEVVEGQHIQITSVAAHKDLNHPIWQRQKVPHSTKVFLTSLGTSTFSVTSRRHTDKSMYKEQSVEKTVFTTLNTFPTILRRSEIRSQHTELLDPLDTALERTLRKVSELCILNHRIESGDQTTYPSLLDAVRNSVDPASVSSVAQYREMIPKLPALTSDDASLASSAGEDAQPKLELQPHEKALQCALIDFASCIRQSLSKLSGPSYHQEQIVLSRQFNSTFASELAVLAPHPLPLSQPNTTFNSNAYGQPNGVHHGSSTTSRA